MNLLQFLASSPSPFHAIHSIEKQLLSRGFVQLCEKQIWNLIKGGSYYVIRNGSSIIAFTDQNGGFTMIGAHSDSPCLKLKPKSKKTSGVFEQVKVQLYGGGLWHTWFDRDLSVAGRLITRDQRSILVQSEEPIMRIPNLAIHLDRTVDDGFKFNKENQLVPVLSLNGLEASDSAPHSRSLLKKLVANTSTTIDEIIDMELCLYDTQKPSLGGLNDEFIYSARLDNLLMSFCTVEALVHSLPSVVNDKNVRIAAIFDNEEVGSVSAYGADSNFIESVMNRILKSLCYSDLKYEMQARSMFISADCAHSSHPNYPDKHEDGHKCFMGDGLVIKHNANQRYATTSATSSILKILAAKNNLPIQEFVVRNDMPCGSTIGPMLSARLGVRTIDVGNAILSMHSIREMGAIKDVQTTIDLFKCFYEEFPILDKNAI